MTKSPSQIVTCIAVAFALVSQVGISSRVMAQTENAATRDYAIALGFEKKGHYPQAIPRWVQFLKQHAKDERAPMAHYHLGLCYYQNKDFPNAATTFQQVLAQHKTFAHRDAAEYNLGLVYYQQALASKKPEDFKKAATAFGDMQKHFPKSAQAAQGGWYQAECLYQADDKPAAVAAYQNVINSHAASPLLPDIYLAIGTTQHELEQHEAAEKSFQTFLSRFAAHKQAPEAKLRLGLVKLSREQLPEAEKFLREAAAVKEFPLADFAEIQLGQALFQSQKFPEASAVFEGFSAKHPMSAYLSESLISAGKSRYREGKFPESEKSLRALLSNHKESPQIPEGSYWLGQTLRALNRSPEAVTLLTAAIADPKAGDFKPQLEFARLEALADEPMKEAETLKNFVDFAARYPQHALSADALFRATRAALTLADYPTARTHAAAFLAKADSATHPQWGDVIFMAGECELLDEKPNYPQAEKFYRELITKNAEHPQTQLARVRVGLSSHSNNQHDQAIAWLNESLKLITEKPLQAESHFLIGRSLSAKKQSQPAVDAFRKSLQADPAWPRGDEVRLALAAELETDANPTGAIQELSQLIAKFPNSELLPQGYSRLGRLKMDEKKWDESAAAYRQLVAKFPEHELAPAAQYHLGVIYFQKPEHQTAVNELNTLLTKWPKDPIAAKGLYLRGASYFQLKQYPQVIADLNAYLATKPEDAAQKVEAQLTLALAHSANKDDKNAAATLQTLLAESPTADKADQAYYELAFAQQKLKEDENAFKTFQTLAAKFPESPLVSEAWFRVGEYQESKDQLDEALKAFRAGLAKVKEPQFKELLLYKIGRVHYQKKTYAEAVADLQKLVTEFPKSKYFDDAISLQAESQFVQDKFTEALPLFVKATQNPTVKHHARAFYRAGQSATRLKKWADAEQNFQAVVDKFPMFPQHVEARYGLAFAQQNQSKFAPARSHYQQVIKDTETEAAARARFMLGECDFAEKKFATAWEHYLEAALGYPYEEWKVQGHYQAARCFIQLKEGEKARDELQTVIEKFPEHALVKDAQQLLKTVP